MATLRADGRWMARHKGKPFYGKTEAEAERLKAEYLNPPTPLIPEVETVHDFAGHVWWKRVESSTEPQTQRKYMSDYQTHVFPVIGNLPIASVKPSHCQAVIAKMVTNNKAWKTKHNVKALMVAMFRAAKGEGLVKENPATEVKIGRKPPKRQRFMPATKALEVLSGVKGTANEASVTLAMTLGLREAEISNLRWEHLDTELKVLRIVGQAIKLKGQKLKEGPPKSGKARSIHLDDNLVKLIQSVGDLDSAWIVSTEGRQTFPSTIYDRWRRVRNELGLATWTFHDLRHAALSLLQAAKAHPFTIMSILGHSKIDTTLLYEAEAEPLQREAMAELSKLLHPHSSTESVNECVNDQNSQVQLNLAPRRGIESLGSDS